MVRLVTVKRPAHGLPRRNAAGDLDTEKLISMLAPEVWKDLLKRKRDDVRVAHLDVPIGDLLAEMVERPNFGPRQLYSVVHIWICCCCCWAM